MTEELPQLVKCIHYKLEDLQPHYKGRCTCVCFIILLLESQTKAIMEAQWTASLAYLLSSSSMRDPFQKQKWWHLKKDIRGCTLASICSKCINIYNKLRKTNKSMK